MMNEFVDEYQHDLGGGYWSGGQLTENGRPVARVSYHGRVWGMAEGERLASIL